MHLLTQALLCETKSSKEEAKEEELQFTWTVGQHCIYIVCQAVLIPFIIMIFLAYRSSRERKGTYKEETRCSTLILCCVSLVVDVCDCRKGKGGEKGGGGGCYLRCKKERKEGAKDKGCITSIRSQMAIIHVVVKKMIQLVNEINVAQVILD